MNRSGPVRQLRTVASEQIVVAARQPRQPSPAPAAQAPIGGRTGPAPVKANAEPARPIQPAAPASEPVTRFLELEIEARKCATLDALRFAMVNSTRKLAAFEQAFLAEPNAEGLWSITLASSVSQIDRQSHIVKVLNSWLAAEEHAPLIARGEPRLMDVAREAAEWGIKSRVISKPSAFWLPIRSRDGRMLAALLSMKVDNWRPQQTAILLPLADAYGHAWEALAQTAPRPLSRFHGSISRSKLALAASVFALAAAFIPVPMSALAPAEIVAAEPTIVTAPLEGVIADILAPPGAWVEKGQPIVRFVDVKLRSDLEVAKRNKAVAEARHFKVVQSAITTQKDMQELATTKAEFELAEAELAYAAELLARSEIKAARSGLLIYAAKSDWIGKPVSVGERLMEIGDPGRSEIKIDLPVADAIALQQGGHVSLFLDGDPLHAISGTITRTTYRPTLTAEQQLAYRISARFADGHAQRIGLRGVARISGDNVPAWFYLFRRPIASVRQRIGL